MADNVTERREGVIKKDNLSQEARFFVEYYSGQLRDIFQEKEITSLNQVKPDLFTDEEREKVRQYQIYINNVLTRGELPLEIAWGEEDLKKKKDTARIYIGPLFKGIFQTPNLEIYTSFPPTQENKLNFERFTITIGGLDKDELLEKLEQAGVSVGLEAKSIILNKDFTTLQSPQEIKLIRMKVKDLGFNVNPTTDQVYAKAKEFGLELCPAEVGPHLMLNYPNQPNNDRPYLYIGMKQISSTRGYPVVFGLGRDGHGLWLDGSRAKPSDGWHPGNELVFSLPQS